MATTRVKLYGPLFDGTADEDARKLVSSLARELAEIGRDWVKLDTHRMTRSGSDTGAAAGGVEMSGADGVYVIKGGIRAGEYAWPWLEGTSKRNATTGFKGYSTFRRTRLRLRRQATPFLQAKVDAFIAEIGGMP